MTIRSTIRPLALAAAFAASIAPGLACAAANAPQEGMQAQQVDKRKLTTIQTATFDHGKTKSAVEVRFLDLPYGAATFGYMENGGNDYYSTRTWPIAHLKLAESASYEGKKLAPGDYVFIITPKGAGGDMSISLASFKPDASGTFLKPGNVFVETPKEVTIVAKKTVKFDSGAPMVDHLMVSVAGDGDGAAITMHYGDRTHTEVIKLK